jgi:glycosyltransferase involved in cell wall biosynthesis
MKLTINILISTINKGIKDVKNVLLNPRPNVEYIVSHQYTDAAFKTVPPELERSDVTILQIKGKGLSRSRNNAIKIATGDIALFADDDVVYQNEYIDRLEEVFRTNKDIDVALFKIKTSPGEPSYKSYPASMLKVRKRLFSPSSVEIAFNIKKVCEHHISFDERFGAGQELIIGSEETIFIEDCLRANLNVTFIPEYIVEHSYHSTIKTIAKYDKRRIWVTGAYDCRSNGSIALLKAFLGTIKILPELVSYKINPIFYFFQRISAVIYILRTNGDQKDAYREGEERSQTEAINEGQYDVSQKDYSLTDD